MVIRLGEQGTARRAVRVADQRAPPLWATEMSGPFAAVAD